jgi:hypothetical protein
MKIFFLLLALSATSIAQEAPCGLRSVTDTTPLLYPLIARAAHVEGAVIFLVSFGQTGEVQNISVLSGHQLLESSASAYVRGLHANEYGGSRICPIVINYSLEPIGVDPRPIKKSDLQHVTVYGAQAVLYGTNDPASKRIKSLWPF